MKEYTACPKCGEEFPHPRQRIDHYDCPYEDCDDEGCRARRVPRNILELTETLTHWRTHNWLGGCSHGR